MRDSITIIYLYRSYQGPNVSTPKSLKIFMLHSALLMVGYVSIRYSLALFLTRNNIPVDDSFTIVTSAFAIQVLFCFFWGYILKKIPSPNHNRLVVIGGFISVAGAFIISTLYYFEFMLIFGIATYIVGISLYIVNFQALTNAYPVDDQTRTYFNQQIFIWTNSGALLGLLIGSWLTAFVAEWFPQAQYPVLYLLSSLSILLSLHLLETNKDALTHIEDTDKKTFLFFNNPNWLPLFIFLMIAVAFILIIAPTLTRVLVIGAFFIAFFWEAFYGKLNKDQQAKLWMAVAGNIAYRISIIVLYVGLSVFIDQTGSDSKVAGHSNIPSLLFYMFDPVANILMGTIVIKYLQRFLSNSSYIFIGTLLVGLAFLFPAAGSLIQGAVSSIPSLFIILAIIIFGSGEFFLAPALTAQMLSLAQQPSDLRYYSGLMQLCSAAGLILGYYIISTAASTATSPAWFTESQLCAWHGCLIITLSIFMMIASYFLKKSGKNNQNNQGALHG